MNQSDEKTLAVPTQFWVEMCICTVLAPFATGVYFAPIAHRVNPEYFTEGSAIGCVLIALGFGIRKFLKRRNIRCLESDRPRLVLPGNRLPIWIILIGLLALTPMSFFWALSYQEEFKPIRGGFWFIYGLAIWFDWIALRVALCRDGRVEIDETGIRIPALWSATLRWREIKYVRDDIGKLVDSLVFDFLEPSTLQLKKRSSMLSKPQFKKNRTSLFIPEKILLVPATDLAAFLQKRLLEYSAQEQMQA